MTAFHFPLKTQESLIPMHNQLLLVITMCSLGVINKASASIKFILDADLYSETVSIHSFTHDWKNSTLQLGNMAFAQGSMELIYSLEPFEYGLLWQYNYLLDFTPDSAKLFYQIQNKQPLDEFADYTLQINAQHTEALGMRMAYVYAENSAWQVTTGLTLLQGMNFLEGHFNGYGTTLNKKNNVLDSINQLNAFLDYNYKQSALHEQDLGWNPPKPTGYGVAIDLKVFTQLTPQLGFELSGKNLWGRMWWDSSPNTSYLVDYSGNRLPHLQADGKLTNKQSLSQNLDYKYNTKLSYQLLNQPWSLSISANKNRLLTIAQLSGFYHPTYSLVFGLHAEPQTQAMGLSAQYQNFGFKYLADHLDFSKARRLNLSIYGIHHW